ncbi:dihydrofolate reductase-like domain-containing protein [Coniella lustricola]|uniref:Dihydrofolate reductase n=1 Tax=Coniella lustricola TaxID=2025994 RepID=A0A2T3AK87_9PEZI|nr:dihydrofolate reductase-like domain-containing protein [Coniella lustricola]
MSNTFLEQEMAALELTLVLAATRDMGIGLRGTLPWTGLRKEMAYFARITKRLPSSVEPTAMNAVIMGRKTWESIPPKFRPLKGRLNIVISRSFAAAPEEPVNTDSEPVKASSLEQAISYLRKKPEGTLGRVFVIGGGQVYSSALEMREAKRVLLTKVTTDFECDTFFSLKLRDDEDNVPEWVQKSKQELDDWAGETVPEGVQVENDTQYEFQMWEKRE